MNSNEIEYNRWYITTPKSIPIYGLERGTEQIMFSSTIVSKRIDDFLRLNSIDVTFRSIDCPEVMCKTSSCQYKISLYHHDDPSTAEDSSSTFVEVVRLNGCGLSFMTERKAILNAAKGLREERDNDTTKKRKKKKKKTLAIPKSMFSNSFVTPTQSEIENILFTASDQFYSRDRRTLHFALQNLVSMTRTNELNQETSNQLCMIMMKNQENILDKIATIYESELNNEATAHHEMSERICSGSLLVLINVISSVSNQKGNNNLFNGEGYRYFIDLLIPSLTKTITKYNKSTYNACLAMTCLDLLLCNFSLACEHIMKQDLDSLVSILQDAKDYGCREHLQLEKISSLLLGRIVKGR